MLSAMLIEIAKVSDWLDSEVSQQYKDQPLAQDWARISKIGEELGEAVNAFILYTGQNPRKKQSDSIHDTLKELADVALTAILAIQHFTGDVSQTGGLLLDSTQKVVRRMVEYKVTARKLEARDNVGGFKDPADYKHIPHS